MFKKFLLEIAFCCGLIGVSMGSEISGGRELYFKGANGKSEFEKMSVEEIEKKTSITFEEMTIDINSGKKIQDLLKKMRLDSFTLKKCTLDKCDFFVILPMGIDLTHINIIGCDISVQDVRDILYIVYPYNLASVDFSDNNDINCNVGWFNDVISDFEASFPLNSIRI